MHDIGVVPSRRQVSSNDRRVDACPSVAPRARHARLGRLVETLPGPYLALSTGRPETEALRFAGAAANPLDCAQAAAPSASCTRPGLPSRRASRPGSRAPAGLRRAPALAQAPLPLRQPVTPGRRAFAAALSPRSASVVHRHGCGRPQRARPSCDCLTLGDVAVAASGPTWPGRQARSVPGRTSTRDEPRLELYDRAVQEREVDYLASRIY